MGIFDKMFKTKNEGEKNSSDILKEKLIDENIPLSEKKKIVKKLERNYYSPSNESERIWYYIAKEDWAEVKKFRRSATPQILWLLHQEKINITLPHPEKELIFLKDISNFIKSIGDNVIINNLYSELTLNAKKFEGDFKPTSIEHNAVLILSEIRDMRVKETLYKFLNYQYSKDIDSNSEQIAKPERFISCLNTHIKIALFGLEKFPDPNDINILKSTFVNAWSAVHFLASLESRGGVRLMTYNSSIEEIFPLIHQLEDIFISYGKPSVNSLKELLKSDVFRENGNAIISILKIIKGICGITAIPLIIESFKEGDDFMRREIVDLLSSFGDEAIIPLQEACQSQTDQRIKHILSQIPKKIKGEVKTVYI